MAVEVHEKWGFGMAPPFAKTIRERIASASRVLDLLDHRTAPPADPVDLEAISTIKGLFTRIFKEDQWDWFTVMAQMGYPPRGLTMAISKELEFLRTTLKDGDKSGFTLAQNNLIELPTRKCLKALRGELIMTEEPGSGWLYILSTREMRDILKIGMTRRTVQERAAEINGVTGVVIPFGVRRCWRVADPVIVEKLAHQSLSNFRMRGDREFFRIDFVEAVQLGR